MVGFAFMAAVAIIAFGAGERLRSGPVELAGLNPRQATILAIAKTLTGERVPQTMSLKAADAMASIESLCGVHPSQGGTEAQAAYDRYRKRASAKCVAPSFLPHVLACCARHRLPPRLISSIACCILSTDHGFSRSAAHLTPHASTTPSPASLQSSKPPSSTNVPSQSFTHSRFFFFFSWWATIHAFMDEDEVKEAVMNDPQELHLRLATRALRRVRSGRPIRY
eukprot:2789763-Rhodomonas_salina.1